MLILPQRRVSQPREKAAPAWSNPIARDLQFLWVPKTDRELIKGTASQTSGTTHPVRHSANGLAAQGNNDGLYYFYGRQDVAPAGTNQFSMMVVANMADVSTAFGHFIGRVWSNFVFYLFVDGVTDTRFWVGMGGNQTISYPATNVAGQLNPLNGKDVVVIATWNGATVTLTVRELGGPWGGTRSVSKSGTFPADATASIRILDRGDGYQKLNNVGVLAAAVWHRPISISERDSLVANPWQIFAPRAARLWLPPQHDLVASHTRQRIASSQAPLQTSHPLGASHSAQPGSASPGTIQQVHHLGTAPSAQHTAASSTHLQQLHMLAAMPTQQRTASITGDVQPTHHLGAVHSASAHGSSAGTIQQAHHLGTTPSAQRSATTFSPAQQLHPLAPRHAQQRTASGTGNAQPAHQLGATRCAQSHASSSGASQQTHPLGPTGTTQRAAARATQVAQIHVLTGKSSRQRIASAIAAAVPVHQLGARHCRHRLRSTRGALPGFNVGPSRYLVHVPVLPYRVEAPEHIEFD